MNTILTFAHASEMAHPHPIYNDTPDPAIAAILFIFMAFFSLMMIVIVYVLVGIFLGKVFKKAGVPTWIAWVPVYHYWKLLQLGGQAGWWAIFAFVPIVNIAAWVFIYIAMYNIGLKFGKTGPFVLFGIFLPIVWMIILGVDKSKWQGEKLSA